MQAQRPPADCVQALAGVASRLGPIACEVLWFPETPSTNDVAGLLAQRGAVEGLVVAADAQTAGRGRAGRSWWSPAGAGLYVSIVLRPDRAAAPLLTLAAGVATAEGIRAATGLEAHVKWPNDLYVGRRKLAGVLCESGNSIEFVVAGIGINVLPAAYPPDIAARATSIESELGRAVDRGLVFAECLAALAARYRDLQEGRSASVVSAWRTRAAPALGRRVEWDEGGVRRTGIAEDVADDGALLVRADAGLTRITSGEVRWLT